MGKSKVIDWEEYRTSKANGTFKSSKPNKHTEKPARTIDQQADDFFMDNVVGAGKKGKGKGKDVHDNYIYQGATNYSGTMAPRCYTKHKPLKIGEYLIYGGSCSSPIVKDADIYVGFERGMAETKKAYPWHDGASFCFPITDGNVPTSVEETIQLVDYLAENLKAGKKIHIGCVGGHGRTGLILSILVFVMTGNKNATEYVRKNYCEKAVETTTQINWLHKHWGIEKVTPSKPAYTSAYTGQNSFGFAGKGSTGVSKTYSQMQATKAPASNSEYVFFETVKPVRVKGNIFGF